VTELHRIGVAKDDNDLVVLWHEGPNRHEASTIEIHAVAALNDRHLSFLSDEIFLGHRHHPGARTELFPALPRDRRVFEAF